MMTNPGVYRLKESVFAEGHTREDSSVDQAAFLWVNGIGKGVRITRYVVW